MFSAKSTSQLLYRSLLIVQGYFHGVAAESTAFAGDAQVSFRSNRRLDILRDALYLQTEKHLHGIGNDSMTPLVEIVLERS